MILPPSGQYPTYNPVPYAGAQSIPQAAQDAYEILSRSLPPGLRVAAIYIASDDVNEGNWALQQLNSYLMNTRRYSVVDPYRSVELIRNYPYFNWGQPLPNEAAMAIGSSLGAQAVIVGNITGYNQAKYLNLQAIDARTGMSLAMATGRMPFYYTSVPGAIVPGTAAIPLQGAYPVRPVVPLGQGAQMVSPVIPVNPVVTGSQPRYYYY
jgi:hypothetical protein